MPNPSQIAFAHAISRLLGWIYTLSWSISFYPQPWLNYKRKSTIGSTVDFPTVNFLGFLCYAISTAALLFSPLIRYQYAARHPLSPEPTIRANDLAFALHAVVLSGFTYSQFFCCGYRRERGGVSRPIAGIFFGSILAIVVTIIIVAVKDVDQRDKALLRQGEWAWIDAIYAFGYAKLLITIIKYMPQVRLNYLRQSTHGWSIAQILLDFVGGLLSLIQLIIDSSLQADWSGITGNPIKFGLSNVSMFFDIIFVFQHFVLYRQVHTQDRSKLDDDETSSLLHVPGETAQ